MLSLENNNKFFIANNYVDKYIDTFKSHLHA
jgi:hypothetical protein